MSDKAIWLTVEQPITEKELDYVKRVFEQTELSERYELIITDDSIDTLNMSELRELIDDD